MDTVDDVLRMELMENEHLKKRQVLIADVFDTVKVICSMAMPVREGRLTDDQYHLLVIGTLSQRLQYIRARMLQLDTLMSLVHEDNDSELNINEEE